MRKQQFKNNISLFCKEYKILIKVAKRKNIKKIQKKLINQIFQEIKTVLMMQ